MAIFTVNNRAELVDAWASATSGVDEIALTANEFSATSKTAFILNDQRSGAAVTKNVPIRAADPLNRPLILDKLASFRRVNGASFINLDFRGTTNEPGEFTETGQTLPAQTGALVMREFQGLTVRGCRFTYYKKAGDFPPPNDTIASSNLLIEDSEFLQTSMDCFIIRTTVHGVIIRRVVVEDERLNWSIINRSDPNWHPDSFQVGLDSAHGPHTNWLIEDFLHNGLIMKGPFISDQDIPTVIIDGFTARNCQITSGRLLGAQWGGIKNALLDGVVVKRHPDGPEDLGFAFSDYAENVEWRNSVVRRLIWRDGLSGPNSVVGTYLGTGTFNGIPRLTISNTANPSGFVLLERGVNCGVVVGGESAPATMTNIATDGRVAAGTWDQVTTLNGIPRYAPTIRFPNTSVGHGAAGNPLNVQWRRVAAGITEWQPTEPGVPTISGGGFRYRLAFTGSAGVSGATVAPDTSMDDITIRYKLATGTLFSNESTYTSGPGIPSPSTPPPGTLDPPTDSEWGVHDVVPVSANFYTGQFWVAPAGVTPTALEWSLDNGTTWLPTFFVELDGSLRTVWQLRPSAGTEQEHVVGYAQTKNIRIRYYTASGVSVISTTQKSFTGPDAPISPSSPGDKYVNGSNVISVGDAITVIPQVSKPEVPVREQYDVQDNFDGTVTVLGPINPPFGATSVWARTSGKLHRMTSEGINGTKSVTIPRGSLKYCYIKGVSADGVSGKSLYMPLPT